jgi:RNA polymerase sigma factor (sigma-70 family)
VTSEQEHELTGLMRRAQTGDQAAYTQLLSRVADVCRRYARGRVGDVPWVEDVVQEALITLHRARRTYDGRRPFAPWLYAILSSRLVDVLRRERRIASRELGRDELPEPFERVAGVGASTVDVDLVRQALEALPPRQREIVTLLKLEDQSVREVSAKLGMSEAAVKIAAHRGYRAIRRRLGVSVRGD